MFTSLRAFIIVSSLACCSLVNAQSVSHVYKINGLLKRLEAPDTLYVVNFWATWCKPCVQELPAFDSLYQVTKNTHTKILLVSLDFKEELEKKVNPFLLKNNITIECVLLDEINGNDFIDRIDKRWSGAIPATFIKDGIHKSLIEKKMHLSDLQKEIADVQKK